MISRVIPIFPENRSKFLASRLDEHGMPDPGSKIAFYRDRDDLLIRFFTMEDEFVYCNSIPGLLKKWVFHIAIQVNGGCSLTATNEA